jgi:transposase
MNNTQKRKILQVDEDTLIIGVDIAKRIHVARAQDYRGIEFSKAISFNSTHAGFKQFLSWMRNIQKDHQKEKLIVGMEPTGHYWFTIANFLKNNGVMVVLVNPMHVKKSKELDDNSPTKNDKKDARVIAQLVKDGRYSEPNIPEGVYADLRSAMKIKYQIDENLQRTSGKIHNWLDRYFPEFFDVFDSWSGKTALSTLKRFPMPQDIITRTPQDIIDAWKNDMKRAGSAKKAHLLLSVAKSSIGLTNAVSIAKQELRFLLEQYETFTRQAEEVLDLLKTLLEQVHGSNEMLSVPGVGVVTVAGFISEIGDLSAYAHPKQIQKLAGLNLKENSSGEHKGRTRISKRGRPKLRALLYRAVRPLVSKNKEFKILHEYYTTRIMNPLKKQQSMIALCCKLIRVLFTLGKNKVGYNAQKLLVDTGFFSLQEAE